jgi:hypothetical protein
MIALNIHFISKQNKQTFSSRISDKIVVIQWSQNPDFFLRSLCFVLRQSLMSQPRPQSFIQQQKRRRNERVRYAIHFAYQARDMCGVLFV